MMPGVISGAMLSWMTIISELSASVLLYTASTKTVTIAIYTEVIYGNYGNAAALSTTLLVLTLSALLLFFKVSGRRDIDL
jgi:iron(III) transport system permease protein